MGRLLLAAVWVAALAGLLVALLVVVDGDDGPEVTTVAPPPPVYSVLARPQTPQEGATRLAEALAPVVQSSVRDAGTVGGYTYLVARMQAGGVCIRRVAPNDAVVDDCAAPTAGALRVIAPYSQSAEGPRRLFGLVPDGITAVDVNGQVVSVTDNVWNAELPPAERMIIDFRTDEGTVADWREELLLDPRADALLSQAPYLGVSCSSPNSIRCDRVGLAVWLREPARSVRAEIGGRSFDLDDPTWSGPARDGLRRMFAGFLQPAGLRDGALAIPGESTGRWIGNPPVSAVVTIEVVTRDSSRERARVDTRLSPGWG